MSEKKIIVVFGATGLQGGSVVKSILSDEKMKAEWTVRGTCYLKISLLLSVDF